MARYLIRRLLWAVLLFFAVTIVSYILFFIIPADPAKQFAAAGGDAGDRRRRPSTPSISTSRSTSSTAGSSGSSSTTRLSATPGTTARASTDHRRAAHPVTASLVIGGAIFWMLLARSDRGALGIETAVAVRPSQR